jgi:uncharacterized surface protein with fasciclin (FAS1) repeats
MSRMGYVGSEPRPGSVSNLPMTEGTHMRSNRTRAQAAMLAGLASVAIAACSGSSDSSSTTPPIPTTVAGPAPTATTTIVAPTDTAPGSTPAGPTSSIPAPTKTILQLAKEEGSLTTMLQLLDTAGLTSTLAGTGPFTLVAPTDAAFKRMDPDTFDKISKSPTVLKQLLGYHLIDGRVSSADLKAGFVASTEGSLIALQATSQLPSINGLTVTRAGRGTNGTILVIESVLLPIDLKLP